MGVGVSGIVGLSGLLGLVNMLGGLIFGYNTGVIAGALKPIMSPGGKWGLNETMQGVVTASILMGALVGSILAGPIADRFGRKIGIITLASISLVFAPVLAISPDIPTLIVARALLGLGVGMSGIVCPLYVSENAPPEKRGTLGVLFQLAITIGIFLAYVSNYALAKVIYNWRIMFAIGALPAFALLLVAFVIPESFVWMAQRTGSTEHSSLLPTNEAGATISNKKVPGTGSSRGFARKFTLRERISMFIVSRALWIGLVLAVAQQLTGINAFMFYAPSIFSTAGLSNENIPTLGLGGWNVFTTILAVPLVGRVGRRPLLIVGNSLMAIACVALGLVSHFFSDTKGWIAVVLLLVFVLAFEIADGPLFWMVAHELFTPEIKTVGQSTLNAAQWIFNIVLTLFFPLAAHKIGGVVYYIFGGIGVVCTILITIFLPETRSKPAFPQ